MMKLGLTMLVVLICGFRNPAESARPAGMPRTQANPPGRSGQSVSPSKSTTSEAKKKRPGYNVGSGTLTEIDLKDKKIVISSFDNAPLVITVKNSTQWSGTRGLTDLLLGEVVSVEYHSQASSFWRSVFGRQAPSSSASGPGGPDASRVKNIAVKIAVDTSQPSRPAVREGTITNITTLMTESGPVPIFGLKEFPNIRFVCEMKQAVKWKILSAAPGVQLAETPGRSTAEGARVRLIAKRVVEGRELVFDLKILK